jgi:hypothetical protein
MSQDFGSNPYQSPGSTGGGAEAASKVAGPAIGLLVTAGIGIAVQVLSLILNVLGVGMGAAGAGGGGEQEQMMQMFSGGIGIVMGLVAIVIGIVVLLGALKMKKLESYGLAMAATILAMVPCISPCCLIGLPIGIWSLVVLLKPEVKSAFH